MKMPTAAIREEILERGAISFARFMELALYCPETGYYETKKNIVGQRGDFITSVSVGSLFGELLAFQFAEWLGESKIQHEKLKIVEAGAHDGRLAADILNWLKTHRPGLFSETHYVIVEPSAIRRRWQNEILAEFSDKIFWVAQITELKHGPSALGHPQLGIIFSNELLDAFPVHRYGWDANGQKWFEWGVALAGEKFVWTRLENSGFGIQNSELEAVLPDNYTVEQSSAAEHWWREAAGIFSRGKLVTIDYGYTAEEQFLPARTRGTLRGYFRHHVTNDLLANPGEQDLTAHVNFSAIQTMGEKAGLKTENFCPQPRFLTQILQKTVAENCFANLDAKRVRQFQMLTHPEHPGRAFRVLVQGRSG